MMIEHANAIFQYLITNKWQYIIWGVIMVSAIIVLIGILKPIAFDRIPYKSLRKACLATTNVAFSFAATAIFYWVNAITFEWYWYGAAVIAVATIVTYWLYETTCLRNLIHKIGTMALRSIWNVLKNIFDKDDVEDVRKELLTVQNTLTEATKKELKAAKGVKHDKELNNL
jgi:hypothetical protein